MVKRFENQDIEFKQEYVPDVRKDILAFVNASGGTVLIGVRKDGEILGVENPDEVMLQVAGSLKDSLAPDVMPFVSIHAEVMEGKNVVVVDVSPGTNRPYYLRDKGLRPSGVYIRKGSSSQPMTDEGIREMIRATSGVSFETARSLNQALTFDVFASELKKKNLEFGTAQMRTLKMIGEDGLYNNLALLLSDECPTTIKIALFQGTDKAVFRDRKEFGGSVLKQLDNAYEFIDLNNKTRATFSGLERTDIRDYPEDAVREALLNCIVHRDYSYRGSTLIHIYDDRIEFISLGGLVHGLTLSSIFLGASVSRNPNLAAVFYRLHLIESYGTGISKIQRAYASYPVKPVFETAEGVFRVTLPNRNFVSKASPSSEGEETNRTHLNRGQELAGKEKEAILQTAALHGQISRKEVEELLSIGSTKAYRLLSSLCEEKKLKPSKNGRDRVYLAR